MPTNIISENTPVKKRGRPPKTPKSINISESDKSKNKIISSSTCKSNIESDLVSTPRRSRLTGLTKDKFATPSLNDSNYSPSTPRRSTRKRTSITPFIIDDEDDFNTPLIARFDRIDEDELYKTPVKSTRGRKKGSVRTPLSVAKLKSGAKKKRNYSLGVANRSSIINSSLNPLQEAKARLHVSAVPDYMPCREIECADIQAFTESKIRDHSGGCMYISGVPGTGKTATVKEVIRNLKEMVKLDELEDFEFIEINGMKLTEPAHAYVQILKKLTGETWTISHAKDLLDARFSGKNKKNIVLLVDELDILWNRKQDVLYNLFDWPTKPDARLVVLAIANTMDMPEKMMKLKVASRLGLTRVQFMPYSHQQLEEIVTCRLLNLDVFDPDAVQLVARKVSSLSGDARRALDICRRATEIAEKEGKGSGSSVLVSMLHVTKAHTEMFNSSRIMTIRNCSEYEHYFLKAIITCFRHSGIEETTFNKVFSVFQDYLLANKFSEIKSSEGYEICMSLAACRLILAESCSLGPQLRIWLNVPQDDITFALEMDKPAK